MRGLVGLALAGVLWLGAGDALAAAPVKGGHYHFVRSLGRDKATDTRLQVEVELTLANDGRELAYPSGVSEQVACGPGDTLTDGLAFDGAVDAPYRALAVSRGGRFSAHGFFLDEPRRFRLTGTFTRDGRFAVGALSVHGGKASCPMLHLTFRAPLVGRPNAPRPGRHSVCDRVIVRQDEVTRTTRATASMTRASGARRHVGSRASGTPHRRAGIWLAGGAATSPARHVRP